MDIKHVSIAGLLGMFAAVVLLWLMDVNLVGWLGVWLAPGAAWAVGALIALGLAVGLSALWSGVVAKQDAVKKLPVPVAGLVFGVVVALLMIFVVPLILSALSDHPGMAESALGIGEGGGSVLGVHIIPALPDLGFDPPLESLAEEDWFGRDDYVGRLLPFGIAFLAYGLIVGLLSKDGK
jgi:hypothetical protein